MGSFSLDAATAVLGLRESETLSALQALCDKSLLRPHRHPELPVLMMSGFAREEKVRACLDAGALGFVSKPFRLSELRQALSGGDHS